MRDDLHHSLPQTSPWRAAVKAACAPGQNGNLADAMTRAAWASGAAWWDTPWGMQFRALLNATQYDMFGLERFETTLNHLELTAPDHAARRTCEIARALILNSDLTLNLLRSVMRAAFEVVIEDGIEHAGAHIQKERPGHHAAEIRQRMSAAMSNCNLFERPARRVRQRRKTVDEGLNTPLDIKF